MSSRNWLLFVFLLVLVGSVSHALYYHSQMPQPTPVETPVTPKEMSSRSHWLQSYLITLALIAVAVFGLGFGARRMPEWAFSFDTEYWLAPERRKETLTGLFQYMLWFGIATIVLLVDVFYQSALVRLGMAEGLGHFWISLGAYVLFMAVWLFKVLARFNCGFRPES